MDGTLTVEDGSLYEFLDLFIAQPGKRWPRHAAGPARQARPAAAPRASSSIRSPRARRNVAHHYDLSADALRPVPRSPTGNIPAPISRDAGRRSGDRPAAQEAAHRRQAAARARHAGARHRLRLGRARPLSGRDGWVPRSPASPSPRSSSRLPNARAAAAGLADRARFHLRDYRARDRHLRPHRLGRHVRACRRQPLLTSSSAPCRDCLTRDGVALLHTIGRTNGPGSTNPWLQKYIFPGGYSPALSELCRGDRAGGLWITDVEILRLHYAETLRHWRQRFLANRDRVAALYDERFCRMWEFYLASSEISFRYRTASCSRSSSPSVATPCPRPATICSPPSRPLPKPTHHPYGRTS